MSQNKATSTQSTDTSNYTDDSTLWQHRYRIAYTNQLPMFKRFADWYDGMYTIVNTKNYTLWRSKVYIPILASKSWNLISKFISMKPGFEVRPRQSGVTSQDTGIDPQLTEKAAKAQLKLEYDYDNPHLPKSIRDSLLSVLVDTVVTGTGLAKVPWELREETRYEHPVRPDGSVDLTKEKVITKKLGYNNLIPVNIFNVFISPSASDLYSAPWIIIKDWKTLDQLKEVNAGKGVEVYKNLSSLEGARSKGDMLAIYKKSRNRLTTQYDPIIADKTVDYLEIYECYDRSTSEILTYVNAGTAAPKSSAAWVEIRRQRNPYWHGKFPLVRFVVKQRPYDFWGEGVWETNQKLQVAMNDILNHYLDNWNLAVDGMIMTNEANGLNDYVVEPGGLITYRTEEPKQFKFPDPNPASLNAIMEQLMQNLESNTISGYATGQSNDETDKTRGTKGGIEALQQAADDLVAFMRMNFQESIRQVGQMFLSNNQQFMPAPVTVVAPKGHQMVPTTITPADLQVDLELRVDEASMQPISDDEAKAQYQQFVASALQLQQASMQQAQTLGGEPIHLNFDQILEDMADKFGLRNTRAIIAAPPQEPAPAHIAQAHDMAVKTAQAKAALMKAQPQPQQQQNPQERMQELINYKDTPDDIKRQMESQAGFRPSIHGVNSQEPQTQQANKEVLKMARDAHASGHLHPAVLDMVRHHLGEQLGNDLTPPAAPIGNPPPTAQEMEQAAEKEKASAANTGGGQ